MNTNAKPVADHSSRATMTSILKCVMMAVSVAPLFLGGACKQRAPNSPAASAATAPAESAKQPPAATPPPASSPRNSAPAADSIRGTVQLVGSDPLARLVLVNRANGAEALFALHGANSKLLERVVGLEVVVFGTRSTERDMQAAPKGAPVFDVQTFAVRAANGETAIDGTVAVRGGAYELVTLNGQRVSTPHLPAALRSQIGARVFLVGSLQTTPTAYGVISPNP